MRNALFPVAFWCLTALPVFTQAQTKSDEAARAYIAQYKDLAISEQKRTGMPAAIKLAQGLHETGSGTSLLATKANNHFGMKCKRTWTGETFAYTDDAPDECFRKYPTAEESYRDQGNYLRSNPRYAACFATDVKDYKTWATELRRAGYATNPKYAEKLTKTIEDYGLQQYTLLAAGEGSTVVATPTNPPVRVAETVRQDVQSIGKELGKIPEKAKDLLNEVAGVPEKVRETAATTFAKGGDGTLETYKGLQGFYATAGQSLLEDATRFNVRYAKLLEWNDLPDAPVPYDMFVFLEKKPSRGATATHVVKSGETLHKIAQQEAIQLSSLRQLNMIDVGEEPQAGEILQLQKGTTVRPAIHVAAALQTVSDKSEGSSYNDPLVNKETLTAEPQPEIPVATSEAFKESNIAAGSAQPVGAAAVGEPEAKRIPSQATSGSSFVAKSELETHAAVEPALATEPAPNVAPVEKVSASENILAGATRLAEGEAEPSTDTEKAAYEDTPLGRLKAKMDHAIYTKKTSETPVEKSAPEPPQPKAPAAVPPTASRPSYHTVAKGETVFAIAKKYGVSVTELRKWNSMDFSAMKVGQKLKLKP